MSFFLRQDGACRTVCGFQERSEEHAADCLVFCVMERREPALREGIASDKREENHSRQTVSQTVAGAHIVSGVSRRLVCD